MMISKLRRIRIAVVTMGVGSLGVMGCGSGQNASTERPVAGGPTAKECVAAWNEASLGEGRQAIRSAAAISSTATLARSRDGVCVVVSPQRMPGESQGFYMSVLGGDYGGNSPISGYGSLHQAPNFAALRRAVGSRPNVRVNAQTGMLALDGPEALPTLRYSLLDGQSACASVNTPPTRLAIPTSYRVVKNNASCTQARVLIYAYVKGEGTRKGGTASTPIRMITGWRCGESGSFPVTSPNAYLRFRLTCTKSSAQVIAQGSAPKVIG
jgi:hypothetical protein